jgi:ribokinase
VTGPSGRVCVVGSINIDTIYQVPSIPRPGETVLATGKAVLPGGKGANQAVAAASMGSEVTFVGCVGDDPEAVLAIASLVEHGIDVLHIGRLEGTATGTAAILVDQGGENIIAVDPGANRRLTPEAVTAHLDSVVYGVVLAQLEIDLQAVMAAAVSSREAVFILNPAPISDDVATMRELLRHTDVLVPNRQELARLAGTSIPTTREELDRCAAGLAFDGTLIVTLGSSGVVVYEGHASDRRSTRLEPIPVETIDTTGAGDAFCGVLAHVLAEGGDVVEAARRANEMAAISTTIVGARVSAGLFRTGRRPQASGAPARSA